MGQLVDNQQVDADLTRLPTGTAGWCALVDHALALGDLSEVDYLELKGTLPFAASSDRKRSAVLLSRTVLGLANRMPDSAERHLDGHGVVLVGIDGGILVGAAQVDGAILHDALQPYLGDDGPRWDYVFVNHPDGLVMAVVVDPPAWGDRIHACRKEYAADDGSLKVRDGDVFVRVPGKIRPATSSDLAELERRRDGSPHRRARVRVEYGDRFDRVQSSSVVDLIKDMVDETADALLAELTPNRSASPYGGALAALALQQEDRRSREQFLSSVEEWREEATEKADEVTDEFLRHQLARGHWTIYNESDRYLEAVRAQVDFPQGVVVLMASDTDYCDHGGPFNPRAMLPKPPAKWGTLRPFDIAGLLAAPGPESRQPPAMARDPEFEVTTEGTRLTGVWAISRPGAASWAMSVLLSSPTTTSPKPRSAGG